MRTTQHGLERTQRTTFLNLLGIDVWVPRVGSLEQPEQNDSPQLHAPHKKGFSSLAQDVRASLKGAGEPQRPTRIEAKGQPSTQNSDPEAVSAASDLPACRILCLAAPGRLLLADAHDLKAARRLGRDLLAALDGNWQNPPTETLFDWPPQQALGVSVSGKRALTAFIARQLDELPEGGVIIACARVGVLLPELADAAAQRTQRVVETETLTDLASDTDAKRRLWTQIQQLTA